MHSQKGHSRDRVGPLEATASQVTQLPSCLSLLSDRGALVCPGWIRESLFSAPPSPAPSGLLQIFYSDPDRLTADKIGAEGINWPTGRTCVLAHGAGGNLVHTQGRAPGGWLGSLQGAACFVFPAVMLRPAASLPPSPACRQIDLVLPFSGAFEIPVLLSRVSHSQA